MELGIYNKDETLDNVGPGEVLHGKLLSLHRVMSLRLLWVLGLEERDTEPEVEETKDKLEATEQSGKHLLPFLVLTMWVTCRSQHLFSWSCMWPRI